MKRYTRGLSPGKVRFGWNGLKFSNLINVEGLPARPFSWAAASKKNSDTEKGVSNGK